MYWPMDVSFAPDGRAYVVDWQNHRVRRVGIDGRFETVMGNDGIGDGPPDLSDLHAPGAPGTSVELNHPTDVDFLPDGRVVVAAWHNHKVRILDPVTGLVTVLIGRGPGIVGDPKGNGDGGPAEMALLNQPKSVVVDAAGGILVTDSRNQRVRRIAPTPDHTITTVAGLGGPAGLSTDPGPCLEAKFFMQRQDENPEPGGNVALDATGRIYLADTYNDRVRRIDPATGIIETIAGTGVPGYAGDGGPAIAAQLKRPRDVELGPDGRLYVADTDNERIRAIDLATGVITTVAGGGAREPGDGGLAATEAKLHRPFGLGFDAAGALYVADTFANRIWKVVMR
jgi:DNA-binding beta-propeller fold protein YncE